MFREFKLYKQDLIQIMLTLIIFIFFVLIPLLSVIELHATDFQELCDFILKFDLFTIISIIIGMALSILRYISFYYPKYTISRYFIAFIQSCLFLIILISLSTISPIQINTSNTSFYLNIDGIFILFISIWSVFTAKYLFDILDVYFNKNYFRKLSRESSESRQTVDIHSKTLIKCPQCNYMCHIHWKRCPICQTSLKQREKRKGKNR